VRNTDKARPVPVNTEESLQGTDEPNEDTDDKDSMAMGPPPAINPRKRKKPTSSQAADPTPAKTGKTSHGRKKGVRDHEKPAGDKFGSRLKRYLNWRAGVLSPDEILSQGIFDDGKRLAEKWAGRMSAAELTAKEQWLRVLTESEHEDRYTVIKYRIFIAAAVLTEHNLRLLARGNEENRTFATIGRKAKKPVKTLNMGPAMAQRFADRDANPVAHWWRAWVGDCQRKWPESKFQFLHALNWGEDKALVPEMLKNGELTEGCKNFFAKEERERLIAGVIAWEEENEPDDLFIGRVPVETPAVVGSDAV
jgi:hypothetical protein